MTTDKKPTKCELRHKMARARGAWYWRQPGRFAHTPGADGKADRVRLILEYRAARAAIAAGAYVDLVNERGNILHSDIDADSLLAFPARGNRSAYDDGPCRTWIAFDTWQDAPYFGFWVDPATRRTFTYCEGDRTLVVCPTAESFRAEVEDAARVYKAPIPAELRPLL